VQEQGQGQGQRGKCSVEAAQEAIIAAAVSVTLCRKVARDLPVREAGPAVCALSDAFAKRNKQKNVHRLIDFIFLFLCIMVNVVIKLIQARME